MSLIIPPGSEPTPDTPPINCTSCRFFFPGANPAQGACRYKPPVPAVIGMQADRLGRQSPVTISVWPGVSEGDWCSKHAVVAGK